MQLGTNASDSERLTFVWKKPFVLENDCWKVTLRFAPLGGLHSSHCLSNKSAGVPL